jgi:hypothetical protein
LETALLVASVSAQGPERHDLITAHYLCLLLAILLLCKQRSP